MPQQRLPECLQSMWPCPPSPTIPERHQIPTSRPHLSLPRPSRLQKGIRRLHSKAEWQLASCFTASPYRVAQGQLVNEGS